MSGWKQGDVIRYTSERRDRHCREGMAIARVRADGSVFFADTFWGYGGDDHVLTEAELLTAELRFNTADYDELPLRSGYTWESYAPSDRAVITQQHGLQRRLFVRKGATEDLPTKVENAKQALALAEDEVRSAQWRVEDRQRDLAKLEAEASGD